MVKRILTASALLVVLFGFLLGLRQIHPYFVSAMIVLITVVAAYEMINALSKAEYKPMKWLVLAFGVIIPVATIAFSYTGLIIALVVSTIIAATIFTFVHKYELKDFFATLSILVYPIVPISLLISLNDLHFGTSNVGLYAILLTVIIPIMTDTMAYFVGFTASKITKGQAKKICPEISPKKTIAGAVGGVIGAVLGALLIFVVFDLTNCLSVLKNVDDVAITSKTGISILLYVVLGIISGPVCEVGDLAASWIKRKAGIKDYGNLFPGHGGVMDRLDSIIFMIPMTLIFTQIVLNINI